MIGLLGGTSWPSTLEYYRYLNTRVAELLGGHHSARLLLRSIDYHPIKSRYGTAWEEVPALLEAELRPLVAAAPGCILICNNTLHRAYDAIRERFDAAVPFVHMVEETVQYAKTQGIRTVLLLGTKDTMENGYYRGKLEEATIEVVVPEAKDRERIQTVQTELAAGRKTPEHKEYFRKLLAGFPQLDGVVLGCTELPLVIAEEDGHPMRLLNPLVIQCEKALRLCISLNEQVR